MATTIWNSGDTAGGAFTLSLANLKASLGAGGTGGIRSTNPMTTGKRYAEIVCTNMGFRGWFGVANSAASLTGFRASQTGMFGCDNGGSLQYNNTTVGSLADGCATGKTARIAIDFDNKLGWFTINNDLWNASGIADPATAVGGIDLTAIMSTGLMLMMQAENNGDIETINPDGAYSFSQPSGFGTWDTQTFVHNAFGVVIS